jgi:hypothetical protein
MSVPDLPIEPPAKFRKEFFNLLASCGNPFHRRGTEVSQGYDVYKLRNASLGHQMTPVASRTKLSRPKPKVTFAKDQSEHRSSYEKLDTELGVSKLDNFRDSQITGIPLKASSHFFPRESEGFTNKINSDLALIEAI